MKKFKLLTTMVALALCLCGFSSTAYASGGDDIPPTEETAKVEPTPLTPEGNLTLVDDVGGEQADNKQFVTVQSKAGNYFYLVIDRDGDRENVYFLNLVDEADLLALIEETPVEPEPEPTPPPVEEELEEPEEPVEKSSMGIVVVFLIIALAGGGAYYYFKIYKPKQDAKNSTNLDDFEFDDDDEEYQFGEDNDDELDEVVEDDDTI